MDYKRASIVSDTQKIILGRDPLLSDLVTVLRQKLDVARVDSEAVTRGSALSPTTPKATRESLDRVSTIRHMFLAQFKRHDGNPPKDVVDRYLLRLRTFIPTDLR